MEGVCSEGGWDGEKSSPAGKELRERETRGRRKSGKQVGRATGRSGGAEPSHEEGEELLLGIGGGHMDPDAAGGFLHPGSGFQETPARHGGEVGL